MMAQKKVWVDCSCCIAWFDGVEWDLLGCIVLWRILVEFRLVVVYRALTVFKMV